jgi:xanthine dehydrogenase accessory factor
MMHDQDWEPALLTQALGGSAFYIGAVGSPHTHRKRCANLLACGIEPCDIDRIKGPIGLVPSMRDASMLAISTLAEIISAYHDMPTVRSANQNTRKHTKQKTSSAITREIV